MSTFSNSTQNEPECLHGLEQQAQPSVWLRRLLWVVPILMLVVALLMRLYHLDVPFDRDGYDEGVYWQSLRAMLAGQSLYHTIFYSQPPAFLLAIFPIFTLFGGSLWSARLGIALISLLGFAGAALLGKALAGRAGMFAALLLLLTSTLYLAESQTLQAEGPSVALTLLALGFALLWWQQPVGRRGLCWASLSGIALTLSIFCKLLCITTVVPIALLMLERVWYIQHNRSGTHLESWLPMLVGVGLALLTSLALVLPFIGSFAAFWSSVVTFHEVAAQDLPGTLIGNAHIMRPVLFSLLGATAGYGTLTALVRKDWRVLPLLAWLLVTCGLLLRQYPLFPHHLVALVPPLITLAVLGIAEPSSYKILLANTHLAKIVPFVTVLAMLLILLTASLDVWQDSSYYLSADAASASAGTQLDLRAASDLRQAITPAQWVITDGQFIAGLADRSTPPALVDTSNVRIATGYVTLAQLEQAVSQPRVHAVLFYTGRFSLPKTADFHAWVAQRFHLIHTYNPGQELWVR